MTAPRATVGTIAALAAAACLAAACGSLAPAPDVSTPAGPLPDRSGAAPALAPTPNPEREIAHTELTIDVAALTGTAVITFAPSAAPGATLEIGDLAIERVLIRGKDAPYTAAAGRLHVALPASREPLGIAVRYRYRHHPFEGASPAGFTVVWPYHCGNLFPCHAAPADGTTFALEVTGVPTGKTAVYPASIPAEAPAYQLAWTIDEYIERPLGKTAAGTQLSVWHQPAEAASAQAGTAHLVAAFDWLERTIGPYRFGKKAGSVSVRWGPGAMGGMEHHPYWHVGTLALADVETHVHEAAHGWFGGGIRLRCWEDFVLSEGTATYLTARALDVVAPAAGAEVWRGYERQLAGLTGQEPVWPTGCGAIDIARDGLFSRAPYIRGAMFYRAVAAKVGAAALDRAIAAFYASHAMRAATMADMLAAIRYLTGYDPSACAERWLRAKALPAPGPCA